LNYDDINSLFYNLNSKGWKIQSKRKEKRKFSPLVQATSVANRLSKLEIDEDEDSLNLQDEVVEITDAICNEYKEPKDGQVKTKVTWLEPQDGKTKANVTSLKPNNEEVKTNVTHLEPKDGKIKTKATSLDGNVKTKVTSLEPKDGKVKPNVICLEPNEPEEGKSKTKVTCTDSLEVIFEP
jgi:hypothetical protein